MVAKQATLTLQINCRNHITVKNYDFRGQASITSTMQVLQNLSTNVLLKLFYKNAFAWNNKLLPYSYYWKYWKYVNIINAFLIYFELEKSISNTYFTNFRSYRNFPKNTYCICNNSQTFECYKLSPSLLKTFI